MWLTSRLAATGQTGQNKA